MRLRFVIGVKISRHFLHQSKGEPSQMVTELSLTFFLQKVFSYFTWQFFLSALQAALSGGVMKVSCFVCAVNPQPCQFSLLFATLEPRRKLALVNFRQDLWDCTKDRENWMQGLQYLKWLIYLRPIFRLTKLAFVRARATLKKNTTTASKIWI